MLRFGALVPFMFMCLVSVDATCVHCKDFFTGCTGGNNCPLIKELGSNVQAVSSGSMTKVPVLTNSLPAEMLNVFTRPVIETIIGIACSPSSGSIVDLAGNDYTSTTAVLRAAFMNHCSYEDAALELSSRMEALTDAVEVSKLQASMDILKSRMQSASTACADLGHGVYTFIFAKVGQYLDGIKKGTVRLASANVKTTVGDLSATIRYPESQSEFFFMLMDWSNVVAVLGLIHFTLVARFIKDVVEYTMVHGKETWQVACALFLVYLKRVERDSTRFLTLANVYRNGSNDTYLSEARSDAAVFFRTRAGTALDITKCGEIEDDKKPGGAPIITPLEWNGKASQDAKQPCAAYNFSTKHNKKSLDASGCCKYAHLCNQWVDDKGPKGMCMEEHKKPKCTYDPKHKCAAPVA